MKNELAFPMNTEVTFEKGLTKREYFAAKAMAGLLSNERALYGIVGGARDNNKEPNDILAQEAVEIADALIKALEE